jgi:hypothetical protein
MGAAEPRWSEMVFLGSYCCDLRSEEDFTGDERGKEVQKERTN